MGLGNIIRKMGLIELEFGMGRGGDKSRWPKLFGYSIPTGHNKLPLNQIEENINLYDLNES